MRDPHVREILAYVVPAGIPYSVFRSWSEDDQDLALQYEAERRSKCPSCGTLPSDWMDEDGKPVEPSPYVASTERCLGCETLDETRKSFPEDRKYTLGLAKAPRGRNDNVGTQDRSGDNR